MTDEQRWHALYGGVALPVPAPATELEKAHAANMRSLERRFNELDYRIRTVWWYGFAGEWDAICSLGIEATRARKDAAHKAQTALMYDRLFAPEDFEGYRPYTRALFDSYTSREYLDALDRQLAKLPRRAVMSYTDDHRIDASLYSGLMAGVVVDPTRVVLGFDGSGA
jgi:hypothetical protein